MQPKFCEKCGAALVPNAMFCENCGSRINAIMEMDQKAQQPISQVPPKAQMNKPIASQANQPITPQMVQQGAYPQTYPQAGAPYVEKPKGRGGEIAGILIGIVLLLSVVMIIVFLTSGSDGEGVQANGNEESKTSQKVEEQTDSKQQTEKKDTAAMGQEGGALGLGEAGSYEGLSIRINGISAPNPDELYDHPKDGMEYVVVNIEIKNESNGLLETPRRNDFTIEIDGNSYGSDLESVYLPENDKYGGNSIEPGETQYFYPLFQVPVGSVDYTLYYLPGFDGYKLIYQFSAIAEATSSSVTELPESDATAALESNPNEYSTTDRPEAEDFMWFTDKADNWVFGLTPVDVQMIDTYEMTSGSWKGLEMIYDYDGTLLGSEFFTITFSGEQEEVLVDIHWHHALWSDGTREELVYRSDEKMIGEFAYGGFQLGGPGNQIDMICYEQDGKQYAEGIWTVQSGETVRVALVRP